MVAAVADTQALIWYLSADKRLSESAKSFFETTSANGDQIALSSISLVEIVYLIEIGRIPAESFSRLAAALEAPHSLLTEIPLDLVVVRSLATISYADILEMPDRIIAATAQYLQVPVISRDSAIQLSTIETIW